MYDAIARMAAYVHGPPIQPDTIVNLDGFTRVHHGQPAYLKRYRDWPGFPGAARLETSNEPEQHADQPISRAVKP